MKRENFLILDVTYFTANITYVTSEVRANFKHFKTVSLNGPSNTSIHALRRAYPHKMIMRESKVNLIIIIPNVG